MKTIFLQMKQNNFMKSKLILTILMLLTYCFVNGQTNGRAITDDYILTKNEIKERIDSLSKDPENWNRLLAFIEDYVTKKDSTYGKWLNDLNLR